MVGKRSSRVIRNRPNANLASAGIIDLTNRAASGAASGAALLGRGRGVTAGVEDVRYQRLVSQFGPGTFKCPQIGTSKAGLDTDQHHTHLALAAARPPDHVRFRPLATDIQSADQMSGRVDVGRSGAENSSQGQVDRMESCCQGAASLIVRSSPVPLTRPSRAMDSIIGQFCRKNVVAS